VHVIDWRLRLTKFRIGQVLFSEKMSDFVSRHYVEEDDEYYGACDLRSDHSDLRAPLKKFLPHLTYPPVIPASLIFRGLLYPP